MYQMTGMDILRADLFESSLKRRRISLKKKSVEIEDSKQF
jgi:hypothetical protein